MKITIATRLTKENETKLLNIAEKTRKAGEKYLGLSRALNSILDEFRLGNFEFKEVLIPTSRERCKQRSFTLSLENCEWLKANVLGSINNTIETVLELC